MWRYTRFFVVAVFLAALLAHYGSGGETSRWLATAGHPQAAAVNAPSPDGGGKPGALDTFLQHGFESLASSAGKAASAIRTANGLPAPGRNTVMPASAAGAMAGFSPGNAEGLVIHTIESARSTLRVAAYSFTSKPIAEALIAAKKRGVDVQVVVDKSQETERYTSATFLANMGVPVRVDTRYAIMHNKFMVIDGQTVQTGSFNYTSSAARRNAENVLILAGVPQLASTYAHEWQRLWQESEPYLARY